MCRSGGSMRQSCRMFGSPLLWFRPATAGYLKGMRSAAFEQQRFRPGIWPTEANQHGSRGRSDHAPYDRLLPARDCPALRRSRTGDHRAREREGSVRHLRLGVAVRACGVGRAQPRSDLTVLQTDRIGNASNPFEPVAGHISTL
ncbi:hypothetical protein FRACA_1920012 [Frankia canadensis]|uniref:Uncharacterized protein n=1 Tax=Frankia canadensis TaxID=1836972 RepID=A0A2I2KPD2_9ACTN|nr:hypothetical protein FRACA_1920012 [Frankia canadensis]SOU54806.1 hypothetical protein FRACA_1920012 [Frankia canadensis]